MRRKDREMDRQFGLAVIDRARYGVMSMVAADNLPYGVPLSLVRVDEKLYFHAAKVGRKAEILAANPTVSVTFVGRAEVPEKYQLADIAQAVNVQFARNTHRQRCNMPIWRLRLVLSKSLFIALTSRI